MNIENLRRLINGEALNKPSVSAVEGFAFESKNVRQGYAYIGLGADADEIAAAVANGAYAVLVEQRCEVIDPEVAFIKVDSLSAALMRLMRFEASYKNLKFCSVNPVQKALLARMSLGKNAAGNAASLLPEDATRLFIKIMKAGAGDLFFTDDLKILSKIAPLYDTVFSDVDAVCAQGGSLFASSVVCEGAYYPNLNFPKVFTHYLCGLLKYLIRAGFSFKLGDTRNLGHFEPVFINKNFRIVPFGASSQAFIAESDDELFDMEAAFLERNFSGGIEICVPEDFAGSAAATMRFKDLAELKNLSNFHYALVKCQKEELEAMLNLSSPEPDLFGEIL